ncbi:MAG: MarR family winged helix-turn-helix transcriptional regulator [Bacilli bacterium]
MFNGELEKKLFELLNHDNNPLQEVQKLSQGENGILKTLLIYEDLIQEDVTPGDLCRVQHLTSGRVASTLKSLEQKEYIERKPDKYDRRRILIKLTKMGKKMATAIFNRIKEQIKAITDKLNEQEIKEFIRLLKIINGELEL